MIKSNSQRVLSGCPMTETHLKTHRTLSWSWVRCLWRQARRRRQVWTLAVCFKSRGAGVNLPLNWASLKAQSITKIKFLNRKLMSIKPQLLSHTRQLKEPLNQYQQVQTSSWPQWTAGEQTCNQSTKQSKPSHPPPTKQPPLTPQSRSNNRSQIFNPRRP